MISSFHLNHFSFTKEQLGNIYKKKKWFSIPNVSIGDAVGHYEKKISILGKNYISHYAVTKLPQIENKNQFHGSQIK